MKKSPWASAATLSILFVFYGLSACSPENTAPNNGSGGALSSGGTSGSGSAPASGGVNATGGDSSASTGGAGQGSGGDASSGGTGSGGDVLGSGGGGGTELVLEEPIMKTASSYVLAFGDYSFEVDPTQGGRIVHFSKGGTNLLAPLDLVQPEDPEQRFLNGGATFWVAPQEPDWGWPPPLEMDSDPFTVSLAGTSIVTESPSFTIASNALEIKKTFSAALTDEAIDIVYEVKNTGPGVASHAPWEVSRHARNGVTFWPKGEDTCGGGESFPKAPTLTDDVYFWDDLAELTPFTADNPVLKLSCDGSGGWMAHLVGSQLFVKKWDDVPDAMQHDVDKEIQFYLGDGYIEVEMRGPYGAIPVDGSISWNVRWYVRPAPTDISPAGLVAAVKSIIN